MNKCDLSTLLTDCYVKQRLISYGKGYLNKGIENLIEIEKSEHIVLTIVV